MTQPFAMLLFVIVFKSYQDDGRVIKKAVWNGIPATIEKIDASSRSLKRDHYVSRLALNILGYRGSCLKANRNVCKGLLRSPITP